MGKKVTLYLLVFMFVSVLSLTFSAKAFSASGSSLFSSEGCIACHTIAGQGGSVGPDLSHVGSQKSLSWIKTQIVNPSAHFQSNSSVTINGKSYIAIMPNHKDIASSKIDAIAEYLESLK